MKRVLGKFWKWYESHYVLTVGAASILFTWQLVHLYWLATHVIALRLFGRSFFPENHLLTLILIFVDYTEIPALLATSLVYLNDLRKKITWKPILFLILLNSQFLHIFWITDEFVLGTFTGQAAIILPAWLAWVAIMIDYLEVPVIIETFKKFFGAIGKKRIKKFLVEEFRKD